MHLESFERFIEKITRALWKHMLGIILQGIHALRTLNGTVNVLHFCTYLLDNLTPISRVYVSCGRVQFSVYVRLAKLAGPVIMFQPLNETTIQYVLFLY